MKKVLKIIFLIVVGVIVLFILLNPNITSFKNYARNFGDPSYIIYKRESNYFVFSVYIKQTANREIQKYYGFAGNFFRVSTDEQLRMTQDPIVRNDSVTTTPTIDTVLTYGSNAHIWMDDLGLYLEKKPNATDEEVFMKFPQLDKNSRKLDVALSYIYAKKEKGMTDDDGKQLYPELYKDILKNEWDK